MASESIQECCLAKVHDGLIFEYMSSMITDFSHHGRLGLSSCSLQALGSSSVTDACLASLNVENSSMLLLSLFQVISKDSQRNTPTELSIIVVQPSFLHQHQVVSSLDRLKDKSVSNCSVHSSSHRLGVTQCH